MQRAGGWLRQVKAALAKGLPLFKATSAAKTHEPKARGALNVVKRQKKEEAKVSDAKSVAPVSNAKSVALGTGDKGEEEEALRRRGRVAHAARLRNAARNRKIRGQERVAPGDKAAKEHPPAHAAEHADAEEKAMLEERWGKIKEEESKMEEEEAAALATASALHKQV
jgi:hypothetical protein